MWGRKYFIVSIVVTLMIAGFAPESIAADRTLIYAQDVAPLRLDPAGTSTLQVYPAGSEVAHMIYDGLTRFTEDLKIEPSLAESWEVNGLTWTFKLRPNIVFHDGTPLNAEAVVADIKRKIDPKFNKSNRAIWNPVERAEAADEMTVKIITKDPYPTLLNLLAHHSGLVTSPAAVKKYGDDYKFHPVGTGPYKLDKWDVGTELTLVKNERYWDGEPGFDRIIIRHAPDPATRVAMLQAGQAQVIRAVPPENATLLEKMRNVTLISKTALRTYGMGFNMNNPILQDKRVRKAINYAVDKQAIIEAIFRGFAAPINSPISEKTPGHIALTPYEYDPEKAKSMLAEAGWKPGPDGILRKGDNIFSIKLLSPDGWFPQDIKVVQAVQAYLLDIGVKTEIEKLDPASYRPRIVGLDPEKKTWDLAFYGFNPSNASGFYHLKGIFLSTYHQNIGNYKNDKVDELIKAGEKELDDAKRNELIAQTQTILWDDAPYIWLYTEKILVGADKKVEGVEVLPIVFTILRDVR